MTRVLVDGAGEQVMGGTPEFIGRYYCFSLENILFSITYSRIIFSFTLDRILFKVYLDIFSQFFIILRIWEKKQQKKTKQKKTEKLLNFKLLDQT